MRAFSHGIRGLGLVACLGAAACVDGDHKQIGQCGKSSDVAITYSLDFVYQVDFLFVIDNSGSMGDEQLALTPALSTMIEALDANAPFELDLRIGFTTTDMGNVECTGTTPEYGGLKLVPANQRRDEFVWPKLLPYIPPYDPDSFCPDEIGNALEVLPSGLGSDTDALPRPWIERTGGELNIKGGTLEQALACYAPQGVDGCGFESQLEAMHRAIVRSTDPTDPNYGFFRSGAAKVVLFVTDEADGSARPKLQPLVFDRNLPADQKAFWPDPQAEIPTSAISWNAGVRCIGDGMPYASCEPADYGVDGETLAPEATDDAVLFPVQRYVDLIEKRHDIDDGWSTTWFVGGLVGVPRGYDGDSVDVTYRRSSDPTTQFNFGIDWGCISEPGGGPAQTAVPPVRLRAFVEALMPTEAPTSLYSICDDEFGSALEDVARRVAAAAHPACYHEKLRDVDPQMEGLQVDCAVLSHNPITAQKHEVPRCGEDGRPADGDDYCWVAREPTSDHCLDDEATLEFELVRAPGALAPKDATYSVSCAREVSSCEDL